MKPHHFVVATPSFLFNPQLCTCECFFTGSCFLVMCCPSLLLSSYFPRAAVLHTNRMERGNKEPTSCMYTQNSTQWIRKYLATIREALECEGKIKRSPDPVNRSFSLLLFFTTVIFHQPIHQELTCVCLFSLHVMLRND